MVACYEKAGKPMAKANSARFFAEGVGIGIAPSRLRNAVTSGVVARPTQAEAGVHESQRIPAQ